MRTHAPHRHTQRDRITRKCLTVALSPTRTLSLCCCQIKAWRAGHKGDCVAAARADTRTSAKPTADQMSMLKMLEYEVLHADARTAAKPTADQMSVLKILAQLACAADWRGVAAQECVAREVAAAVRTSMQSIVSIVYSNFGRAYVSLGDFNKAIEYHTQDLAIEKEVGDRGGEGRADGNLGCVSVAGGLQQGHRVPHAGPGDCKGGGRPGGGGPGVWEPLQRVSVAGGLHQDHRVPHAAPSDCKGGGRPEGRWQGVREPRHRVSVAWGHQQGNRVPHTGPGDCKGGGRPGGGVQGIRQNLGCAYDEISKAIEYHTQTLAIAKEMGDRAGEGRAYGNLGCAYQQQGDFSKGIEYNKQDMAIAKETTSRTWRLQRRPLCNRQVLLVVLDALAEVPLRLINIRAAHQGPATGSDQAPGPHSHSSASACLNDRVREAEKWLQAVFDCDRPSTCKPAPSALHLLCGPRGHGSGASQKAPLMARATGT